MRNYEGLLAGETLITEFLPKLASKQPLFTRAMLSVKLCAGGIPWLKVTITLGVQCLKA
jgi:hypothetical protein